MKILEFIIVCLIIIIEWVFIYLGYEKSKKKMVTLRQKIEGNNIEMTLQKIDEFIHFSNNFNIGSLYYIADLDLKRVENTEINNTTSMGTNSVGTFLSQGSSVKKTNLTETLNETSFNNIREGIKGINNQKSTSLMFNNNTDGNRITPGNTPLGNNTPGNEPDGKKNLLKVMHRLEQIKGIKKTKDINSNNNNNESLFSIPNYEKTESKDSKISNDNSQLYNNENVGENNNNDNKNNNIKNENNTGENNNNKNNEIIKSCFSNKNKINNFNNNINNNINNINSISSASNDKDSLNNKEIKSVLRTKEGNIKVKEEIKLKADGNEIGLNEKIEDSKMNILKNDEGIGLIPGQKRSRVTKVQFKEKNVRYYSPGQNVNETSDENFKNNQNKEIDDSSEIGKDLTEYKTSLNNNNNKKNKMKFNPEKSRVTGSINLGMSGIGKMNNRPLLNEIKSSNNSLKNNTPLQKNSSNVLKKNIILNDKNITPVGKDDKENSFNDINKFQLIDQGKAVTVKKNFVPDKNNINTKEEIIEYKIDNIIQNNLQVKLILNITLGIFIILYIVSLSMNFSFNKNIENAKLYTTLLYNKTSLLMGNILNYQFHVIRDYHDEEDNQHNIGLEEGIIRYENNRKKLTNFETEKNPKILESTYNYEMNLRDNNFCSYFSKIY